MSYNEIKFNMNSSFLVTGGAGFIGSNLVEALLKLNYKVRVLDNFITGNYLNIEKFKENTNFELIEGDICNLDECIKACQGIDYVLHQAALGSVPRSVKDPKKTNETNIGGTLNMLIAAERASVKRFVYASSSSVYGDDASLPKIEGKEGAPLSPYAITKVTNELYANNFYKLYGLKTIGLRYFNVFGKKQNPDSEYSAVIPLFIKKLLKNESPTIHGDGLQSRDFTYIENVIEANLKACIAKDNAWGDVFNIAYGGQETLINLYDNLSKLLNKNIKPNYSEMRLGDIKHSNANISKAKSILGYNPDYDIVRGLEQTILWYIENYS